jgi:hypothetical protein
MPAAALAQPLGISTPRSIPFPLLINGNEISGIVDGLSYAMSDPGFTGIQTLEFDIHDHNNAVFGWLAKQQRVLWYDQSKSTYLFQGFVKQIQSTAAIGTGGPWPDMHVTCSQISEVLDFAQPLDAWDAGAHGTSDQAQIQCLIANMCQEPNVGVGGYIQVLNSSTMPASIPCDRTTLRNATDAVLAANGVNGSVAYVDNLGYLHTLTTAGDVAAPYNIAEQADLVHSVPALVSVDDQGAADIDALWVIGGTEAATGAVTASVCGITTLPRSPMRWDTLEAPSAVDRNGAIAAATAEFYMRQNMLTVTAVVTGFDGWAKGQSLTITSTPFGWTAKSFIITGVDMKVLSGTGIRQYTLTCGTQTRLIPQAKALTVAIKKAAHRAKSKPVSARKVTGQTGQTGQGGTMHPI